VQTESKYLAADFLQVLIARHYEREHGASVVSVGNAPKWDIRFNDGTTAEVKCDVAAAQTLNAAVEFWDSRRNKPTGILETEAKLWIHCVPEGDCLRCYEVETKRLLRLCFECGSVKSGGDYNSSLIKIIPLQEIQGTCNSDFVLQNEYVRMMVET
jgi:hypothetical protein